MFRQVSVGVSCSVVAILPAEVVRLDCVNGTSFGLAVVPEV